ncbi:unnamed protein product [Rotaria socialis]|uniref:LicD/FKTN/FKRP nucleotidyltransferase domain-containing protein n=2 Tax=Rotaria socialis TaxID=392032 RepID=A0A818F798_9BILA|nr:unnamed protein product [Rotaria socialis]
MYRFRGTLLIFIFLFFFLIIIFYDDQKQFASNIYNKYKHSWIEQALGQMHTCTPNDGLRQRALLYTLLEWTQLARKNKILYWIGHETLISYVQRHGLSPHALDLDILVMVQDTSHLVELRTLYFSSDYELKVHPQWHLVGKRNDSYFNAEGIDFVEPIARFINRKDHVYINIWPMLDYHPNKVKIGNITKEMFNEYDENDKWESSPKEWTFPLRPCRFSGVNVYCPAEPEKLITNISSIVCINGSWQKSDEPISTKTIITNENSEISEQTSTALTTNPILSDEELLEKALNSVPTCQSNDRDRQRYILHGLQAWSHLAEKYNIQYWISYGTLVGFIQRRGLLPHDLDTDVMIMFNDTRKLVEISKLNFSSTYEIKVQPQWEIFDDRNRSYFRKDGIHFVAPNARFIHLTARYHVDIYPVYDFNPIYANRSIEKQESENLTAYDNYYNWLSYPRSWTYPLKTCYFSEIKVLCPAQPEKFIELVYGTSTLTKSHKKCVEGNWVNAD